MLIFWHELWWLQETASLQWEENLTASISGCWEMLEGQSEVQNGLGKTERWNKARDKDWTIDSLIIFWMRWRTYLMLRLYWHQDYSDTKADVKRDCIFSVWGKDNFQMQRITIPSLEHNSERKDLHEGTKWEVKTKTALRGQRKARAVSDCWQILRETGSKSRNFPLKLLYPSKTYCQNVKYLQMVAYVLPDVTKAHSHKLPK